MKITYKGVTKECKYYKGLKWDKPLTAKMKQFEKETGKNAVYRGQVTGTFEYWMYWKSTSKKKPTPKKQSISNQELSAIYLLYYSNNDRMKACLIRYLLARGFHIKKIKQFFGDTRNLANFIDLAESHKNYEYNPTTRTIQLKSERTYQVECYCGNIVLQKGLGKGKCGHCKRDFYIDEKMLKGQSKYSFNRKKGSEDRLKGGYADKVPDKIFDKEQLKLGIKVEMEHTNNSSIAREIATDHLVEDPNYYTHLIKMEKATDEKEEAHKQKWIKYHKDKIRELEEDIKRYRTKAENQKTFEDKKYNYKQIEECKRDIKKSKNKILEYELRYPKLVKLIDKLNLRKSKWYKGRVAGSWSPGYYIHPPTIDSPTIEIGWHSYQYAKAEKQKEDFNKFESKITPILQTYKYKYKIQKNRIIIIE